MVSKIKIFTPGSIENLQAAMIEALKPVGEGFGVSFEVSATGYRPNSVPFKVIASTLNSDGTAKNPDKEEWDKFCSAIGLEKDDFGREFTQRGRTFKITGLKLNRPKYPVNAIDVATNKGFKFPVASVTMSLRRNTAMAGVEG